MNYEIEIDDEIEIIENTKNSREKYGYRYSASILGLKSEHIKALHDGKCLAFNNGEYSTFIVLEDN